MNQPYCAGIGTAYRKMCKREDYLFLYNAKRNRGVNMRYIMWYLLAINIVTFFLYGIDKQKARKKRWRIPEATLLSMAALGGSVGACVGMQIFRHKTQKPKFYIGVPVILLLQAGIVIYVYLK